MKRFVGAALLAGLIAVGLSCGGDATKVSGPGELKVLEKATASSCSTPSKLGQQ